MPEFKIEYNEMFDPSANIKSKSVVSLKICTKQLAIEKEQDFQ